MSQLFYQLRFNVILQTDVFFPMNFSENKRVVSSSQKSSVELVGFKNAPQSTVLEGGSGW